METPAVFSFIGAVPRTDWLPPQIERDAEGFINLNALRLKIRALRDHAG